MHDYDRIAAVIRYVNRHRTVQPGLQELADVAGLSPSHFHRLFARWAGVTPKDFLQCLTLSHARQRLKAGRSVLDTAIDVGLSGPGRLHDLCVTLEAASPGEIKSGGSGWTLVAGFADSPFGLTLVAHSPRGLSHLSFIDASDQRSAESTLKVDWPNAVVTWNNRLAERTVAAAMPYERTTGDQGQPLRCVVRGSEFQVRVWNALLQIPAGELTTYGDVAAAVDEPTAARAVGTAIARNQIAVLIPCHRVIRETGVFGRYRWSSERKQAIIAREMSHLPIRDVPAVP